jgi:hypothetical protein
MRDPDQRRVHKLHRAQLSHRRSAPRSNLTQAARRSRRITQEAGPSAFFHLAPKPGTNAGFQRCAPLPAAPHSLTFATWLRLEHKHAAEPLGAGACLFALLSADPSANRNRPDVAPPSGVAAAIVNGRVVVHAVGAASSHSAASSAGGTGVARSPGAPALATTFGLTPRTWHHLAVTVDGGGKLIGLGCGDAVVTVFVDGQRVEAGALRVTTRCDAGGFFAVGSALDGDAAAGLPRLAALEAQMATVYVFDAPLPVAKVRPSVPQPQSRGSTDDGPTPHGCVRHKRPRLQCQPAWTALMLLVLFRTGL